MSKIFVCLNHQFFGSHSYSPLSERDFCSVLNKLNFIVSSITVASKSKFGGKVQISMTFSMYLEYNIVVLEPQIFGIPNL